MIRNSHKEESPAMITNPYRPGIRWIMTFWAISFCIVIGPANAASAWQYGPPYPSLQVVNCPNNSGEQYFSMLEAYATDQMRFKITGSGRPLVESIKIPAHRDGFSRDFIEEQKRNYDNGFYIDTTSIEDNLIDYAFSWMTSGKKSDLEEALHTILSTLCFLRNYDSQSIRNNDIYHRSTYMLGEIYSSMGNYDLSDQAFLVGLGLSREIGTTTEFHANDLIGLAINEYERSRFDSAIQILNRLLASFRINIQENKSGIAISGQKDIDLAIPGIYPSLDNYREALGSVAAIYEISGRIPETEIAYQNYLAEWQQGNILWHASSFPPALDMVANFYYRQGQYQEAERLRIRAQGILEAAEKDSPDPQYREQLALELIGRARDELGSILYQDSLIMTDEPSRAIRWT